jgi:hypothetical protein
MLGSVQPRAVALRDLSRPLSNRLNSAEGGRQQNTAGIGESAEEHRSFRFGAYSYCIPVWSALVAPFGGFRSPPLPFLNVHSKRLNLTSLACSEGILLCPQSSACFMDLSCSAPGSAKESFRPFGLFCSKPGGQNLSLGFNVSDRLLRNVILKVEVGGYRRERCFRQGLTN